MDSECEQAHAVAVSSSCLDIDTHAQERAPKMGTTAPSRYATLFLVTLLTLAPLCVAAAPNHISQFVTKDSASNLPEDLPRRWKSQLRGNVFEIVLRNRVVTVNRVTRDEEKRSGSELKIHVELREFGDFYVGRTVVNKPISLSADWIILSACNTASSHGTPAAEDLSGLARTCFAPGAQALLVSHWAVSSDAAVALTTRMFDEFSKGAPKAEALRRSMLALMANTDMPNFAHPAFWAPFVYVGD